MKISRWWLIFLSLFISFSITGAALAAANHFVFNPLFADELIPQFGIVLDPPTQSSAACLGEKIQYSFTVINTSAISQVIDLVYSSAWPVDGPSATPLLEPSESWLVEITHTVSAISNTGDTDTIEILAIAGAESDSATITSKATVASGWEDQADLTSGRGTRNHSLVYWDGKLYKIGGIGGASVAQPWLDIYDIASDTWSSGADMPAARYGQDCVAIDARIYCAGGYLAYAQSTLDIYDIDSNAWISGATMPEALTSYAGVELDGKYYVIGGSSNTIKKALFVYDPINNIWDNTLSRMSTARRSHMAGVIDGKIYVAGGENSVTLASSVVLASGEVYDPASNVWSPIANMPQPWMNAADAVMFDRYLVLTGAGSTPTTASTYAAAYDVMTNSWDWQPNIPHLLYSAESDGDGTNVYIASGRTQEGGVWDFSLHTTVMVQCPQTCRPLSAVGYNITPSSPTTVQPVTFLANVDGGDSPYLFNWDFGDGAVGTGETVVHTYSTAGQYTAWLTATNCGGFGSASISHSIKVLFGEAMVYLPLLVR